MRGRWKDIHQSDIGDGVPGFRPVWSLSWFSDTLVIAS